MPRSFVVQREGPHPIELVHAVAPPLEVGRQYDFGVAFASEAISFARQRVADLVEIEDFSVECHDGPAAAMLVHHRLVAHLAEVNNGKATVAETQLLVDEKAFVVRPAMTKGVHHLLHQTLIGPIESRDSAHHASPRPPGISPEGTSLAPLMRRANGPSVRGHTRGAQPGDLARPESETGDSARCAAGAFPIIAQS